MADVAGRREPLRFISADAPDFAPHRQLLVELHAHAPFLLCVRLTKCASAAGYQPSATPAGAAVLFLAIRLIG
jgi:hypothetical protein